MGTDVRRRPTGPQHVSQPDPAHSVITPANVAEAEMLIRQDRLVNHDVLAAVLKVSAGSAGPRYGGIQRSLRAVSVTPFDI